MASHPYHERAAHSFWNTAVAGVPPFALDPMVHARFRITADDKVATAGSCFAQHIARRLAGHGFSYYVVEQAPAGLTNAAEYGYGVFSARYGNIYTSRQLVQLFDRAYGKFRPEISTWSGADRGVVDPFRPRVQPGGFSSMEDLVEDRERHLASVRALFETLDVFVFTLGLTEGWRHVKDDAALPVAPGVSGGTWDPAEYRFVNSRVSEVVEDLTGFVDRLKTVNARARVLLTVSPVPLIATYQDRHVLVSTVYSKSVLRVAAEEVVAARSNVDYFPSYEIVTATANSHRYFADDLRSVNALGVDHVMRVFFKHYGADEASQASTPAVDFRREAIEMASIICDEDAIA